MHNSGQHVLDLPPGSPSHTQPITATSDFFSSFFFLNYFNGCHQFVWWCPISTSLRSVTVYCELDSEVQKCQPVTSRNSANMNQPSCAYGARQNERTPPHIQPNIAPPQLQCTQRSAAPDTHTYTHTYTHARADTYTHRERERKKERKRERERERERRTQTVAHTDRRTHWP